MNLQNEIFSLRILCSEVTSGLLQRKLRLSSCIQTLNFKVPHNDTFVYMIRRFITHKIIRTIYLHKRAGESFYPKLLPARQYLERLPEHLQRAGKRESWVASYSMKSVILLIKAN